MMADGVMQVRASSVKPLVRGGANQCTLSIFICKSSQYLKQLKDRSSKRTGMAPYWLSAARPCFQPGSSHWPGRQYVCASLHVLYTRTPNILLGPSYVNNVRCAGKIEMFEGAGKEETLPLRVFGILPFLMYISQNLEGMVKHSKHQRRRHPHP